MEGLLAPRANGTGLLSNPQGGGLLDYLAGGASGINRSAFKMADSLVGNPLAGLANSLGADIESDPVLRMMQELGIGRDAVNPQQQMGQNITGMVGDVATGMIPGAGDLSGLALDREAMEQSGYTPAGVALAGLGALPFVPPLLRMVPDRMWQNPANAAAQGQLGALMYHGTPNQWAPEPGFPEGRPRFDDSTARTGEGINAYGAGFYAAEDPGVAHTYAKNLGGSRLVIDGDEVVSFDGHSWDKGNERSTAAYLLATRGDPDKAIAAIAPSSRPSRPGGPTQEQLTAVVQEIEKLRGSTVEKSSKAYQFDFPDELMPSLLDLDVPLNEQSWFPKGGAKQLAADYKAQGKKADAWAKLVSIADANQGQTGNQFINNLASRFGGDPAKVSEFLASAGIPGSKFMDGNSRKAGTGTSNYVLFRPQDHVTDVRRMK